MPSVVKGEIEKKKIRKDTCPQKTSEVDGKIRYIHPRLLEHTHKQIWL